MELNVVDISMRRAGCPSPPNGATPELNAYKALAASVHQTNGMVVAVFIGLNRHGGTDLC